jgi:hypothetical protein
VEGSKFQGAVFVMTFISNTVFNPLPGKAALAHERIRRLSEIMSRAGARVRLTSVAWGDGASEIRLFGICSNMAAGAKVSAAFSADPAFAALRAEAEKEPATTWEGPEFWRCVFGEPQPGYTVLLQREYEMDRRHVSKAIALMPELQALQGDRPVLAAIPAISGDMARFMAVYYATSLDDLGERIDGIGGSEAFQSILLRAAELGKLTKARVLVNI